MPKQREEMTQAEKIEELRNGLNQIQAEAEQRLDQLGQMVSGAYRGIEQAERRMGLSITLSITLLHARPIGPIAS
jgi:hypothetical protein